MWTKPFYQQKRWYESRVHEFRVARGLKVHELAELADVSPGAIAAIANGTVAPLYIGKKKNGDIKPLANRLVKILNASLEDLFPAYFCSIVKEELLPDQVRDLSHPDDPQNPADILELNERRAKYGKYLRMLPARQRMVLDLRFNCNLTLRECGEQMGGKTREYIRQLESKALFFLRRVILRKKGGQNGISDFL